MRAEAALINRDGSRTVSERGAARLAHRSGGPGVASSNLAVPTILELFEKGRMIANFPKHLRGVLCVNFNYRNGRLRQFLYG